MMFLSCTIIFSFKSVDFHLIGKFVSNIVCLFPKVYSRPAIQNLCKA